MAKTNSLTDPLRQTYKIPNRTSDRLFTHEPGTRFKTNDGREYRVEYQKNAGGKVYLDRGKIVLTYTPTRVNLKNKVS